jgi:hypothetical protein
MAKSVGQPFTAQKSDVAFSDMSCNDLLFSDVPWDEHELRLFPGLAKSEPAETPAPAASVPVAHLASAPAQAPRPSLLRNQVPAAPAQGPYARGPIPQHQYIPVPAGYLVPQLRHIPSPFDPARRFVTMLHHFRPKQPLSYIAALVLRHFNISMTPADVASIHAAIPFSWLSGYAERLRSDGLQALSKAELQEIRPWLKEHAVDKYKQFVPYLAVRFGDIAPAREKIWPMLEPRGEKERKKMELVMEMRRAKRQLEDMEAEDEMEMVRKRLKRPKGEEEVSASEPHAQPDRSANPQLKPLRSEVHPTRPSASDKPRAARATPPGTSIKSTMPTSSCGTGSASPCILDVPPIPAPALPSSQFFQANPADPETVDKFIKLLLHSMPDIALNSLHSLVGTELGVWMTAAELKEGQSRRLGGSSWLKDLWTRSKQHGWGFLDPAEREIVKIWLRRHQGFQGKLARDLGAEMEKHEAKDNVRRPHTSSPSLSATTFPPTSAPSEVGKQNVADQFGGNTRQLHTSSASLSTRTTSPTSTLSEVEKHNASEEPGDNVAQPHTSPASWSATATLPTSTPPSTTSQPPNYASDTPSTLSLNT